MEPQPASYAKNQTSSLLNPEFKYLRATMNLESSITPVKVSSPEEIRAEAFIRYSYLPG
jgi:hypothetical protein